MGPYLQISDQTNDRALLHCEVTGAALKLQVAWRDRAGNQLTAVETYSAESGGGFNLTLQTSISESGCYRCVVTQEDIGHQVSGETCWDIIGRETHFFQMPLVPVLGHDGLCVTGVSAVFQRNSLRRGSVDWASSAGQACFSSLDYFWDIRPFS